MRVARAGIKKKSNDRIALPVGARNSSSAASGNRSPSLTMAEAVDFGRARRINERLRLPRLLKIIASITIDIYSHAMPNLQQDAVA